MFEDHIVIYGGSFNPPHVGHQAICLWALQALGVQSILVVPTYEHNFGKPLADFNHRVAMCDLMVKPLNPWPLSVISATGVEELLPKPNTTYGLLKHFSICGEKLAIIIGSELLDDLTKWYMWEELPKLAKIIVANRPGFPKGKAPFNVTEFPIELPAISSSEIRNRLSKGESIDGLVPLSVKEYIYQHGLYKSK